MRPLDFIPDSQNDFGHFSVPQFPHQLNCFDTAKPTEKPAMFTQYIDCAPPWQPHAQHTAPGRLPPTWEEYIHLYKVFLAGKLALLSDDTK